MSKINLILGILADGKKRVFLIDSYDRLKANLGYEKYIIGGIIVFCAMALILYSIADRKKVKGEDIAQAGPLIV